MPHLRGDGGPATDALLSGPKAVAVFPPYRPRVRDESRFFCEDRRAIYVLDSLNGLVRKIDRDGVITTFAGSGLVGLESGACNGVILPAGPDTPNAGLGSAPADPRRVYIKLPRGLAVDSRGRVFIADCRQRILVVNPEGTQLRRVVGRGRDISVSSSDPDYYLDCEDEPRTPLQDIGDGGNPLDAILFNPGEMVFDADEENLYFADLGNNRIRRVGPYDRDTGRFSSGATIQTVAGNGVDREEEVFSGSVDPIRPFHQPYGLDIDPRTDALYFSDGVRVQDLQAGPGRETREAHCRRGTEQLRGRRLRCGRCQAARAHIAPSGCLRATSPRRTPRTSASAASIRSPTDPDPASGVRVSWIP